MDVVEGWRGWMERVGPGLVPPVVIAVVITVLAWLMGGWFGIGPWPWALAALPVVVLSGLSLTRGWQRAQAAGAALDDLTAALVAAGHADDEAAAGRARAALRLVEARLGGGALDSLGETVSEDDLEAIRGGGDPLQAVLGLLAAAAPDPVARARTALARCDALATRAVGDDLSGAVLHGWLWTLPIGLVDPLGLWGIVAVAGIGACWLALRARAQDLARPFGPVDPVIDVAERVRTALRSL